MKTNYFTEDRKLGKEEVVYSGKYCLRVNYYRVGEPEDHYWDFSKGLVYQTPDAEQPLFEIERNYPSFWSLFILDYKGIDYLIAGRDYHGGYSVFDLTNKKEYEYKPKHSKYTAHFCWVDVEFNREEEQLEVYGCYWAAPFEYVTFDFSNPANVPLPELERRDEELDYDEDEDKEIL